MTQVRAYFREPRNLESFIGEARRMIADGAELEAVWTYLRATGVDLSDSITVTVELTGVVRREAKWAVCHSATWSDWFPAIVELHDSIEHALHQLAEEEPGSVIINSGSPTESSR
jgi:hypothetical protein